MSTPTDQQEKTTWCDAPGCEGCIGHCSVMESLGRKKPRNETPWRSVWWWTTLELPKSSQQRADFILIIITILSVEFGGGVFLGVLLREIFGWPF